MRIYFSSYCYHGFKGYSYGYSPKNLSSFLSDLSKQDLCFDNDNGICRIRIYRCSSFVFRLFLFYFIGVIFRRYLKFIASANALTFSQSTLLGSGTDYG